jgi:hypothetical protein
MLEDLDQLAQALAEELEHTDDPGLALEQAKARLAQAAGEPSGFAGPAGRTDEVEFTEDGRPVLLFHKGLNFPKTVPKDEPKGKGGLYDSGSQPSALDIPNLDQITNLQRRPFEKQPTEGSSFLTKVMRAYKVSARNLFFKDVVSTVKQVYPDIKMVFPEPPTYIWNPKDENEKLDIMKIKNNLKIRFPELEWTHREMDGVAIAPLDFPDGSSMDFTIGEDANHLTLTYYKPESTKTKVMTDEGEVEVDMEV